MACRREAAAELGWSALRIAALRRANRWFAAFLLPASGLALACLHGFRGGAGAWAESASRVALLVSLIALFIVVREALHPERGVLAEHLSAAPDGWLGRLRWVWFGAALVVPLGLAWLDAAGYGHTAAALLEALVKTGGVALVAAAAGGWLRGRGAGSAPDGPSPAADVGSRRLRLVLGVTLFVALGSVWADVLPALGYLHSVQLWTVEADGARQAVSAADLLRFVLVIVVGVVAARAMPGLSESALGRLPVDVNLRYGIGMVAQYVVVIVTGIAAFDALHVGWSKLQWLAAGLSVGVGFGLQEIVANFIAGLIILFERPIRIGDVVTVGETTGTVTGIHARSTTVRDFDGKELIVPNKELITTRVTNWDLSDRVTRIQIAIGVAYGSDTARVEHVLLRVARECTYVIQDPPPRAVFSAFGDNALQFVLYVFLPSRDTILDARHALHTAIDRAMREAGIEIAFPQRDVHLDSRGPLRVRIEST